MNDQDSAADTPRNQSASLEQSDAFYRSLVESLPQNFLRKDRHGRLIYANTLYCQTVGKRLDEILGKLDIEYFPAEMAEKYMADDQHVMSTGEKPIFKALKSSPPLFVSRLIPFSFTVRKIAILEFALAA